MMTLSKQMDSALRSGDAEYVKRVELDVLQNWENEWGSALILASIYGSLNCCEEILKRCPSLLYKTRKTGRVGNTALHSAAYNGHPEVIKLLLSASVTREKCGDIESGITTHDDNNKLLTMVTRDDKDTPLHLAVERNHLESAKLLIEADPDNNLLRMVNKDGNTAMHIAVNNCNLGIVKLLVEADPDVEYCTNVMGKTPLFIAFQEGLTSDEKGQTAAEIRKLLIEKQPSQCKVPIAIGTNNWTLLHHAAYKGDLSTIDDIIKFCPECLEIVDIDNQNFLHIAVKFEHINVVKTILELSTIADEILNGQDNHGNTPLHIAAIGQNAKIAICFLYNSRVRKTIRNMQGLRAIDIIHFDYDKRKAEVYGLIDRVDEKEIKDQTEFDLLVGALIATVSFAAGIAVPGGYTSDGPNKGTAVLAGKISFKVFVISNTIALLLSLYAVFSHFCLKYLHKRADIIFQLNMATYCSFGAIFAMVITFIAGSYAVLAVTEEFSVIVSILCCCFFCFAFYGLWRILMQDKPSIISARK
ncbi:hypothetical protein AQUCO_04500077v1 [Aquilegia coerulea]|uniref:PGG domain-containing protein n=1 Tax=Aquilegia coerulea TaxID=218851 RepID=A0A2G5CM20_AQUCA|nr:hypothetical protein AQUCO_04500077v1 [Aquilegia coerulea]